MTRRGILVGLAFAVLLAALVGWRPVAVAWCHHQARKWLDGREDTRALETLRAALRLDPDNGETHLLLARVYRRLGKLDEVEPLLRRAEQLGVDRRRADRLRWLVLAQAGRLREAEPQLADLLVDPRDEGMDICEAYVQGYFSNLRIGEALRLLEAWQKDYPRDPQPHFMRGFLMQALARWKEAAEAYRQGLQLAPDNVLMRCALGEVLVEMGQFDEAEGILERCAESRPENPRVLYAQANCLYRQGRTEEAAEVLKRLLATWPDHFEGLRLAGQIALAGGRFQLAADHLQRAAALRPYDTTTRNALGQALRALGRNEEAQPHFEYVAQAEDALHRMERQLQRVVERPRDTQLRYEIGTTLLRYGSPADGAKWLRSVLELDPHHRPAHAALAAYYEAAGDLEQAAYHRRLAASPSADSSDAATSTR